MGPAVKRHFSPLGKRGGRSCERLLDGAHAGQLRSGAGTMAICRGLRELSRGRRSSDQVLADGRADRNQRTPMNTPSLFDTAPRFDGPSYDPAIDQARLTKQLGRVFDAVYDGAW